MKHAVWLFPLGIAVFVVETLSAEKAFSTLLAAAFIAYGSLAAYWLGIVWERRWTVLAAEKVAQTDPRDGPVD
jgi:predicted small integral membrane protein